MLLPFAFVGLEGFRVLGFHFTDLCRRLGFESSRVCLRVARVEPCVAIVFRHLNCDVRLVGRVPQHLAGHNVARYATGMEVFGLLEVRL